MSLVMNKVVPAEGERTVPDGEREFAGQEREITPTWIMSPVVEITDKCDYKAISEKTNKPDASYDSDFYEDSKFFTSLKPMFITLKFTGIFFRRRKGHSEKLKVEKSIYFCVFVCLVLLANIVRSFFAFDKTDSFDEVFFFKIQQCLWSLENFTKACVMVFASYRTNLLPRFFKLWREICADREPDAFLKTLMRHCIVLAWQFTFVNTLGVGIVIFLVPGLSEVFLKSTFPGAVDSDFKPIYKVAMVIIVHVMSSVSTHAITALVVLSAAVSREFFKSNKEFSSHISRDGKFDSELESHRLRHQGLCRLVDVLDDIFNVLIAVVFMSNIPMCCVILYNLIYASEHLSAVLNIFWVVVLMFYMTVVAVACACVNTGAHAPLASIYNIKAQHLKYHELELSLFLNRLNGFNIGLSALKMFVINRPAILTIFGMLITYFVLLVQFKSPVSTTCHCVINSTGNTWNGSTITT